MKTTDGALPDAVRAYLDSAPLGRLATVDRTGAPQNKPVSFRCNDDGTIDVGGHHMADSAKYRNVAGNPRVSLVVDDIVSTDPWTVRFVEIRGPAHQAEATPALGPGFAAEVIQIVPDRVLHYGFDD